MDNRKGQRIFFKRKHDILEKVEHPEGKRDMHRAWQIALQVLEHRKDVSKRKNLYDIPL